MTRSVFKELALFTFVGGIGFVVDVGVLYAVRDVLGLYLGRIVSFLAAALTTWVLNRRLTFRGRSSSLSAHKEAAVYVAIMMGGGFANYLTYAVAIYHSAVAAAHPALAVAAGSLAGLGINWGSARVLLFKRATT